MPLKPGAWHRTGGYLAMDLSRLIKIFVARIKIAYAPNRRNTPASVAKAGAMASSFTQA
jgi:hypothetical protein